MINHLFLLYITTRLFDISNAEECLAPRPCYLITTRDDCLDSRDSRPGYLNQPCTWCDGPKCTGFNNNKCEPVEWLFERTNQVDPDDFIIASKGLTPRPCWNIDDASLCLSSKDSRIGYKDQPCVWCGAGACTTFNDNRCEPAGWLFERDNQLNPQHYDVAVACTPLTGNCLLSNPCWNINDVETCLSSKDNRLGYLNEPCTWCHGGPCTGNNNNRCEPTEWLFERSNQINPGHYEIASSGLNPRACWSIQDRISCLSSKDNRANYLDQPCVWCGAGPCTTNNDNRCEPAGWLFEHNQLSPQYYQVAVACTRHWFPQKTK